MVKLSVFLLRMDEDLHHYSFQGGLYIIKYCMLYRIFETNCSLILINTFCIFKEMFTEGSVGWNK
jgi:hypothetical protein